MYLIKRVVSVIFFWGMITSAASSQTAAEIVQEAYKKMEGESSRAEISMQIIRPNWERSVSMKSWSLGEDFSLILVTAPARDEGTAFLMRNNEIWNWLPDVNRTIKMPPSMMSQSWMGSDFSNNDLVRESSVITDYTYEMVGDSTVNGYDCYKIEMIPTPDAPIVWARVVSYISKEEYLNLRVEYFDEDNEMLRVMTGTEIREINGRLIPSRMEMNPVEEEGHSTVITYQNIEFNIDISEQFFSIQNMKRIQ